MPRSWGAQAAAWLQEWQARTAGGLARAAGVTVRRARRRGSLGHGSRLLARIRRAAPAQNTSPDSFSPRPAQMLRAKCGSTARRPDNVPTCSSPRTSPAIVIRGGCCGGARGRDRTLRLPVIRLRPRTFSGRPRALIADSTGGSPLQIEGKAGGCFGESVNAYPHLAGFIAYQ